MLIFKCNECGYTISQAHDSGVSYPVTCSCGGVYELQYPYKMINGVLHKDCEFWYGQHSTFQYVRVGL